MSTPEEQPMLDVARGDVGASRMLHKALQTLKASAPDNPAFARLVDEVVAGRRSFREAAMSPEFAEVLNPRMQQASQYYRELSDEDKERLAAEGEQALQRERETAERLRQARERPPDSDDESFDAVDWLADDD